MSWSALIKLPLLLLALAVTASSTSAATFDAAIPPGRNFDKAEFRLWVPDSTPRVRAVVVLMPGSNGDGRAQVDDEFWRLFATRNGVALLGCRLTDKPHDQSFIEEYVDVARGSGQALLDVLQALASQSRRPEIASVPLLLWGMSAGGQFNYEFTVWKPERVAAFVVNKGGIYYTALAPAATRRVPGIFFTGEKDLEFRVSIIDGLFAINRRAGALWAYIKEPGAGHEVAHSREFAVVLFEEVLAMRVTADGQLRPIDEQAGLFADPKTGAVRAVREAPVPTYPVSWLPSARLGRAWEAVFAGRSPESGRSLPAPGRFVSVRSKSCTIAPTRFTSHRQGLAIAPTRISRSHQLESAVVSRHQKSMPALEAPKTPPRTPLSVT